MDLNANEARILSDQFWNIDGALVLAKTYSAFEVRATEEEWLEAAITALEAVYEVNNSTAEEDKVVLPMTSSCLFAENCPLEAEDWCSQDPECSVSPYQEPEGAMLPGPIAGFVLGGIAILLIGCYILHLYLQRRQAKRYKTVFAKRIAETIQVNKSIRSMGPEELAEEFKRVDLQTHDGLITKDDLWEFISSGKAGEISKGDFNALFAAIDADGDGQVDFLAFCAFMGQWYVEDSLHSNLINALSNNHHSPLIFSPHNSVTMSTERLAPIERPWQTYPPVVSRSPTRQHAPRSDTCPCL